jgi:anti-sigma factor RsiW
MTCGEVEPLLSGFADGELPGQQMRDVARHLAACRHCEEESGRLDRLQATLRRVVLAGVESSDAAAFWESIAPRLQDPAAPSRRLLARAWASRAGWGVPAPVWVGGALAAALLAGVFLSGRGDDAGAPGQAPAQIASRSRIDSIVVPGNVTVRNTPESDTLIIWVDADGLAVERLDP